MENILGVGGITISDLNDALISGDAPRNPEEGALWIDSSANTPVLKVYKNGSWKPQEIDVSNLDPELSETVTTIVNTLGTLANDGLLTYADRLQLSVEIASIIGQIPSKQNGNVYPNTLPAYNTIDSRGVGSFSNLRQTARDATVPTDNDYYIALEQAYKALNTYLSSLTPRPWDVTLTNKDKNTEVANPDTYREALLNYYLAEMNLATYTEKRASDASKEYTDASVQDAITSVDVEYATSTESNTVPNDDEWDTLAPTWGNGLYIWSRTLTTYKNGSTFISEPVNITGAKGESGGTGAAGRSITKIQEQYYVSDSATEQIGGKWENEYPGWEEGKFAWTRSVITFTNPSGTHTTDPVSVSGAKGDKGDPGSNAPTIKISGASQMIKQDALGGVTPSASFNVIGVAVNTTITKWSYSVNGGAFGTGLPGGVTRSGNVVTITPKDVTFNTLSIRAEDGTVADTFTIGRAVDGEKGDKGDEGLDGADAITVLLSNESHTFQAGTTNAIGGSTTTDIHAYKGTNKMAVKVGTITEKPKGMESSISNNGKENARVTFEVDTDMTSPSGIVTIPLTVDGKIINKEFSYALTFKGDKGDKGDAGVSITLVDVEYAQNDSETTAPTSGWNTTAPTWKNGKYIWSRTKTTYSSGDPTYSKPACITGQKGSEGGDGNDGKGISSIVEQYYLSDSKETRIGGSWETTAPKWEQGKYMWTRSIINWINPTDTTETTPIVDIAWEAVAEATKGVGLSDKTEILSGNPVWTDKADDDSVVHVEVDGASYQEGQDAETEGSINLLPPIREWEYLSNAELLGENGLSMDTYGDSSVSFPINYAGGPLYFSFETLTYGDFDIYIYLLYNDQYEVERFQKRSYIPPVGERTTMNIAEDWMDVPHDDYTLIIELFVNGAYDEGFQFKDPMIDIYGDRPYESYGESGQNVQEIHSVNDVDIVSSVGGRNLVPSNFSDYLSSTYAYISLGGEGETFTGKIEDKDTSVDMTGIYFGFTKDGIHGNSGTHWLMTRGSITRTTTTTDEYKFYSFYPNNQATLDKINARFNVQIEKGSTATPYSQAPEDIQYDELGIGVYKTNLLLSEPLRSVGDVKDRLFRDGDGLWKVERNVEVTGLEEAFTPFDEPIYETLPTELQDKLNNIPSFKDSNYVYTIDKTDILSERLKPTLHATFKGGGWYDRFKLGSETERLDKKITDGMEEVSTAVNAEWKTEADSIRGDVEATYVTANDFATLQTDISTSFTQTEEAFDFRFKETETLVSGVEGNIETLENEIKKYIRFVDGSIILGAEGSTSEVIITNEKISFMQGGDSPVAFIEGQKMQINHGIFVDSATIAGFKFQLVPGTTDVLGITWTDI